MNNKVYIDFDSTLFDTHSFYNDFINICNNYKVETYKIDLLKKELFNDEELFNLDVLIKNIVNKFNIDNSIYSDIDKLYSNKYVYSDSLWFLKKLKDKYSLVLLTYGDIEYQVKKIKASKLEKYFDNIIITNKHKGSLDLDYKNLIFIDDNLDEIKDICRKKPKKVIRIKRNSLSIKNELKLDNVLVYTNFKQIFENEFK